jgi:hypothetical protein
LNIRNVFSQFEWDGDWSLDSELWDDYPSVKKALKPDSESETFWIEFDDFDQEFEKIFLLKSEEWHEARFKSKFIKVIEKNGSDKVLSKFYYTLSLTQESTVFISVH